MQRYNMNKETSFYDLKIIKPKALLNKKTPGLPRGFLFRISEINSLLCSLLHFQESLQQASLLQSLQQTVLPQLPFSHL